MKLLKNPLVVLILLILCIIIIIAIFRATNLTAGFGINGHIGEFKGSFSIEAFENDNKPMFLVVYADWCGHCKRFMPEYNKLKNKYDEINGVKLYAINSEDPKSQELVQKLNISGFPTMRMYPKGLNENYEDYDGDRTAEAIIAYLQNYDVKGTLDNSPDQSASF